MVAFRAQLFAVALIACTGAAHSQTNSLKRACELSSFGANSFVVCKVDFQRHELKLYWMAGDGRPYGGFERLRRSVGDKLIFAMNAGMFEHDLSPTGLYIESKETLVELNPRDGWGNFYLKPNGVFFVDDRSAYIMESTDFEKLRPKVDFATQSGPLLIIDGKFHPKLIKNSSARKIRNGVGVCSGGSVHFVISNRPVSFYDFAEFFRDRLQCSNALYLDGSISSLFSAELNRNDRATARLGPIVGAVVRKE